MSPKALDGQSHRTEKHLVVYPDLALVRCRRLDQAAWIIARHFDRHFAFRVLRIWYSFFLSSHRRRSLVGFRLRYSSDIGRSSYSVLPIVSPFIVSLPLNRTSGPNQSLQLTAGRRDDQFLSL